MSQFVGAAMNVHHIRRNDRRNFAVQYQDVEPPQNFRSPWWPRAGFVGDPSVDGFLMESVWYEQPEITRGISARLAFLGLTRDQYGSPLAGCTVLVFRTSDRAFISETISDENGAYTAVTFNGLPHFLVFYKAGVPDVFGTSVNTLVGS